MNEPKRYTLALPDISYGMDESNKGEYVLWMDYARLKAEVERLNDLCKKLSAQHSDISCENIMLRKAGDAMERSLSFEYPDSPKVKDWNAAKEGKPSV